MGAFALQDFEQHLGADLDGRTASPFGELRQRGYRDLSEQGLPTPKTEDWKYTSVRALIAQPMARPDPNARVAVPATDVDNVVVVVNGRFRPDLSRLDSLPAGVVVTDVHEMPGESPAPTAYPIGDIAALRRHPFAALNSACFDAGLMVDVQAGVAPEQPLLIQWLVAGNEPVLVSPRLRVRLGEGAGLNLVERHYGQEQPHLSNKVGEFSLAAGARLDHLQIQQTGQLHHINGTHIRCERDSHYRGGNLDLAGSFIRNDLVVSLAGPGADAEADGLFLVARGRHVDNHVRVDHLAPHCHSRVLYKGLLGGGRGVFNGKLIVHRDAQKTNARQTNHNLLLAPDVDINAKPELEIYADDVQCSHGCTTGELDHDQLFYLLSRGIDRAPARQMLVSAFAGEVRDNLPESLLSAGVDTDFERAINALVGVEEVNG